MNEIEQCKQCGFDSERWTRADLTHAFSYIAGRAVYTMEGLPESVPNQRPDVDTWSMLEYLDHVREVTWAHRFLVDMARQQPGVDLGSGVEAPPSGPSVELDRTTVVDSLVEECLALEATLEGLDDADWDQQVVMSGAPVTVAGGVAHALHDAIHHMHDLGRIRVALGHGAARAVGSVHQINISTGGVPKFAVSGRAEIDESGVVGDVQRNRRHHGRPFQALCLWSSEVLSDLRAEGHPIEAGSTGENLTLSGLDWPAMRPGTILDVGDVRCEITAYAVPCGHNNQWFGHGDSRRIRHEDHPGWSRVYASVLKGGVIDTGAAVVVEPDG